MAPYNNTLYTIDKSPNTMRVNHFKHAQKSFNVEPYNDAIHDVTAHYTRVAEDKNWLCVKNAHAHEHLLSTHSLSVMGVSNSAPMEY